MFYEVAGRVVRALTAPEAFLFTRSGGFRDYRFWPHKVDPGALWPPRVPGPQARETSFIAPDRSWGLWVGERELAFFGKPLIDAFFEEEPRLRLLSSIVEMDGERLHG